MLTAASPTLLWRNKLAGFKAPAIKPVAVLPPKVPVASIALAGAAGALLLLAAVGAGGRMAPKSLATVCIVLAVILYPFVRTSPGRAYARFIDPTPAAAGEILDGLLTNVYRSFDMRDESSVFDRLAVSVSGDQLTDIYLQSRKALELEQRGGARGKVDDVAIQKVRSVERQADGTFAVDGEWTVSGSVSHFGHTHFRQNRYHAVVNIVADGDAWRIRMLTVLDERRLL